MRADGGLGESDGHKFSGRALPLPHLDVPTCTHHDHVQEAVPRADGRGSEHLVPSDADASAFPPTNYCAPTCEYDHQPECLRLCHEAMGHEAVVNPIVNGLLVQRLFDEVPFHRRKCSNPMETTEF